MAALNPKMGVQPPLGMFSVGATISSTVVAINDAFVYGTSGPAALYKFTPPVSQTSGTLTAHVYMTAQTGSASSITAYLNNGATSGQDPDRPENGGSPIATSTAIDVSSITPPSWITFTFTVTLTRSKTYWLIIANTTGTPASNHISLLMRPQNFFQPGRIIGFSTTNGVTTDPSTQSSSTEPAIVFKFDDGTLMGNPYVLSTSSTSNDNYRGTSFQYDGDIEMAGILNISGITSPQTHTLHLFQGATELFSYTPDTTQGSRAYAAFFDTPITFTGGLRYDVVVKPSGSNTFVSKVWAGSTAPTDVNNAMSTSLNYVNGATPGSFTEEAGFSGLQMIPNNIPAQAAGGGQHSYTFGN